jgi:uncharacterized protein
MIHQGVSDTLKLWFYATVSVFLGAWITPIFYNAGKALAEVCRSKSINAPLEWLAGCCAAANLTTFFEFGLQLSGGLFFLLFLHGLCGGSMTIAKCAEFFRFSIVPREWGQGMRRCLVGFLVMALSLSMLAGTGVGFGILEWKGVAGNPWRLGGSWLGTAVMWAFFQELFFRGLVQGRFERAAPPGVALGLSALFFALVHFLKIPESLNVADPDASGVGIELLKLRFAQLTNLRGWIGSFMPMLSLGVILAVAYWRRSSLWLPVGLHAGWIFTNSVLVAVTSSRLSPGSWWLAGARMEQGILPLFGILWVGGVVYYLSSEPKTEHETKT